ncbi:MAG: hypothetical protein VB066_01460, partial [Paludibacter sp.]|nr:hypothetical protein [Paludibacter sp.]
MKRIIQYFGIFLSLLMICSFVTDQSKDCQLVFVKGEGVDVGIFQNGSCLYQQQDSRISEIPQTLFGKDFLIVKGKNSSLEFSVA